MSKYKRTLMPFLSCDIAAMEKWLCDMARKGYIYESSSNFTVRFEVSEPVERRYRVEYADVVGCHIKDEKRGMYEDCGWTVVNDIKTDLVVVFTDDSEAPEPYAEPSEMIKPLEDMSAKQRRLGIAFLVMFLFSRVAAPITSLLHGNLETVHSLINIGTWKYIGIVIMSLLLLCEGVFRLIRAKRLRNYISSLRCGTETAKDQTKKTAFGTALILLTVPLVILWVLHIVPTMAGKWYEPADPDAAYPFPMLSEINAYEHSQLQQLWENGAGVYSSREDSDLLAPVILEFEADRWADPHVSYSVDYYEMRSEKLAKQMYDEEIAYYQVYTPLELATQSSTYQYVLKHEGKSAANDYLNTVNKSYSFYDELNRGAPEDVMYIVDNTEHNEYIVDEAQRDGNPTHYQVLFVRSGNKLMCVHYLGQSDLKEYVELFVSYINK